MTQQEIIEAIQESSHSTMNTNLFTNLPSNLLDELFTTLLEATNLRIERIVSHGHSSPESFWYDQDQHEWVLVLQGAARLSIEGESIELKPGDHINIPAHQKHQVEWTTPDEPTVWLAVFYGDATAT
ncbi:cupin domain-containing protein [Pirellulaceae bacterium SH449]